MNNKGQTDAIIQFIADHPGCYMSDVIREMNIAKGSVTSVLFKQSGAGVLRREGFEKRYRYYVVNPADRIAKQKSQPARCDNSAINPLSNLFNQRLAEVRGGRKTP